MSVKSTTSNENKYFSSNLNIEDHSPIPFHSQKFADKTKFEEQFEQQNQTNQNENRYNESESSREDYLPLKENIFQNKSSIIKGTLLAFIFFSIIIYSVLYMLSPEKSANLIFEGEFKNNNNDTSIFDEEKGNNFYKLDTIIAKQILIIFNISLNVFNNYNNVINDNNNNNNDYKEFGDNETNKISIILKKINNNNTINNNQKTYFNVDIIFTDNIVKKLGDEKNGYFNITKYNVHDFPFWLELFIDKGKNNNSKDENEIFNITSDYLSYCFNIQKDSINNN